MVLGRVWFETPFPGGNTLDITTGIWVFMTEVHVSKPDDVTL